MELDPVFKPGLEVIEFEIDANSERIKAQTHTWKTNEFFLQCQNLHRRFSDK